MHIINTTTASKEPETMIAIAPTLTTKPKNDINTKADNDGLRDYIKTRCIGFERITGKCRAYFDFDPKYDTEQEQIANEYNDLKNAIDDVRGFIGFGSNPSDLRVLTACGLHTSSNKWINSIHIIINNTEYEDGAALKAAIKAHKGFKKSTPDMSIYKKAGKSQLFRLPYCSKQGENRPFKITRINEAKPRNEVSTPIEKLELDDENGVFCDLSEYVITGGGANLFAVLIEPVEPVEPAEPAATGLLLLEYLDLFHQVLPDESINHTVRDTRDKDDITIINFNRLHSSYCSFCERQHIQDNTGYILIDKKNKAVFYGCNKFNYQKDQTKKIICLREAETQPKQTKDERIKAEIARRIKKAPAEQNKIKADFDDAGFNTYTSNTQYCEGINALVETMTDSGHNIVAVRSDMGTGKTYANSKCIKSLLLKHPAARVCVLSMRISLATKYKEDYEGFTCYLDEKTTAITSNKVIIQLDSLHRLKWGITDQPNILIIDEADQAINHMVSSTYMKNENVRRNNEMFRFLVNSATQIVMMSANLTAEHVSRIKAMRSNQHDTAAVFINTYHKKQNIVITATEADIIKAATDDLQANRKIFIASNNKVEKILTLQDQLLKNAPNAKILVICRDTLRLDTVKAAMDNPNEQWGLYDAVIVSPSVQGGISYDRAGVFHNIYGMAINLTNSSGDFCQMLRRVRSPINNDILVSYTAYNGFNNITDRDEFINHISINRDEAFKCVEDTCDFTINKYGINEFKQNAYFNMYVDLSISRAKDTRGWIGEFIRHMLLYDNTVSYKADEATVKIGTFDVPKKLAVKFINDSFKETMSERATKHSEDLAAAEWISTDKKRKIHEKMMTDPDNITDGEELEYKKRVLNDIYNVSDVKNPVWYMTLNNKKTIKQYKTLEVYFEQRRPLGESLEALRLKEIDRERYLRSYAVGAGDRAAYGTEEREAAIINSLNADYKYKKHKIIIDVLLCLGFDGLDPNGAVVLTSDELKERLIKVYNTVLIDMEYIRVVLGKAKKNMVAIKAIQPDDKNFTATVLKFINGCLTDEMGLSIASTDTRRASYKLHNKNIEGGLFINPYDETAQITPLFGDYTPTLGRKEAKITEEEEYITIDEQLKMLYELREQTEANE